MTFTTKSLTALAFCTAAAFAQDSMDKMEHGKMEHGKMMKGKMMKGGKMAMMADSKFAMGAASGGMMQVALGKMAVEKGSSQAVKDFGQKMVDDHTKANDELKSICSAKNMAMPSAPNAKDQAVIDKMSKMSGAAFDKAYIHDMVMDHNNDVMMFTKESNTGMDSEMKSFAAKTLPTLKEHQKMINDMAAKKM